MQLHLIGPLQALPLLAHLHPQARALHVSHRRGDEEAQYEGVALPRVWHVGPAQVVVEYQPLAVSGGGTTTWSSATEREASAVNIRVL